MIEAFSPGQAAPRVRRMLLIVASYLPEIMGGAERQATILAAALASIGVRVTLIAPSTRESTPLREETAFGEIVRFRVSALPAQGGRNIAATASWVRQIEKFAASARGAYDAVYVFHARLHAIAGVIAAQRIGCPLFIKLGGQGAGSDFNALRAKRFLYGRAALGLIKRAAAGFVANSAAIVEDLRAAGIEDERILSFPNGVVVPPASTVSAAASRDPASFIFAGRFDKEKSLHIVIEAVDLLAKAGRPGAVTFLGRGPHEADFRAMAAARDLGDRVRFEPATDDVYPHLLRHGHFLSPSVREGQSNALLEAIATGCVPIVAPASGVRDVVRDGENGFVCEPPTSEGFADAMSRACALSRDERLRMALSGHAFAESTLSIEAIAARTVASFEAAIARRADHRRRAQ